jgi:hypothetical protein
MAELNAERQDAQDAPTARVDPTGAARNGDAKSQPQRSKSKRAKKTKTAKEVPAKAQPKRKASIGDAAPLPPKDPQGRWNILAIPANLHQTASRAEDALVRAKAPLYVHGSDLKRPIVEEVEAAKGHRAKIARLVPVGEDALRDELSKAVHLHRWDKRAEEWQSMGPSRDVAKVIASREGQWRFPAVAGVITTPTLRADGSLLSKPGYDAKTRLLLVEPLAVDVPARPTKDNARAALAFLDELLAEFPFVDEPGRSVALSTLITPVVRGALPVAPMHTTSSPTPGSGKSYLLDTASAIAIGQRCPVISAGRNEYETEARLCAVLITAQPLVSIDNLNGILRGDALCQFIERHRVQVRILGETRTVTIENRATIFGNGNNLTIAGDLVRRTVHCRLDANVERPELRQFVGKPFDRVLADRTRYVSAALTIVRAYLLAGCPGVLPALASFEDWSSLVRSALVWLGCADPAATMEQARAEDPDRAILLEFSECWRADPSLAGCRVTTGELRGIVEEGAAHHGDQFGLRGVLLKVAGQSDSGIDTVKLGRWLSNQRGRVINGMKLCSEIDSHSKQQRWFLQELKEGGA